MFYWFFVFLYYKWLIVFFSFIYGTGSITSYIVILGKQKNKKRRPYRDEKKSIEK